MESLESSSPITLRIISDFSSFSKIGVLCWCIGVDSGFSNASPSNSDVSSEALDSRFLRFLAVSLELNFPFLVDWESNYKWHSKIKLFLIFVSTLFLLLMLLRPSTVFPPPDKPLRKCKIVVKQCLFVVSMFSNVFPPGVRRPHYNNPLCLDQIEKLGFFLLDINKEKAILGGYKMCIKSCKATKGYHFCFMKIKL